MERYERLRELGRGSYGCAVLVRDRNSRQQRAGLSVTVAGRNPVNHAELLKFIPPVCSPHLFSAASCITGWDARVVV